MSMPVQKPGKSKQDYGTPWEFIHAVQRQFGRLDVDLAARSDNAKAPAFVTPEQNALTVSWSDRFTGKLGWLNPEFARLDLWAAKCRIESAQGPERPFRVIMLSPASVGTEWFAEHVHGIAYVLAVRPRLTFEGCVDPYPKDLMLSLYGFGKVGFNTWRWRK